MRKRFFIVMFVLIFLVIGILGILSQRNKEETSVTPTHYLPTPQITNYIVGKYNIESKIKIEDFNFPEAAPTIEIAPGNPLQESEVFDMAQKAGFNRNNYITSNDIKRGLTYIFKGQDETLTVYSKANKIVYVKENDQGVFNKQLSNEAIIKTAESFLIDKSFKTQDQISLSFITFLKIGPAVERVEVVPKENATTYIVNFAPIKSDIKLVEFNPFFSPISVWVLPDGSIAKAEITNTSEVSFSQEKYVLKNYDDFLSSINQATVVSLDDGNLFMGDLPNNSIERITVEKAELAYYKERENSKTYQPIFLLNGLALLNNRKEPVKAILFLPAVKNP